MLSSQKESPFYVLESKLKALREKYFINKGVNLLAYFLLAELGVIFTKEDGIGEPSFTAYQRYDLNLSDGVYREASKDDYILYLDIPHRDEVYKKVELYLQMQPLTWTIYAPNPSYYGGVVPKAQSIVIKLQAKEVIEKILPKLETFLEKNPDKVESIKIDGFTNEDFRDPWYRFLSPKGVWTTRSLDDSFSFILVELINESKMMKSPLKAEDVQFSSDKNQGKYACSFDVVSDPKIVTFFNERNKNIAEYKSGDKAKPSQLRVRAAFFADEKFAATMHKKVESLSHDKMDELRVRSGSIKYTCKDTIAFLKTAKDQINLEYKIQVSKNKDNLLAKLKALAEQLETDRPDDRGVGYQSKLLKLLNVLKAVKSSQAEFLKEQDWETITRKPKGLFGDVDVVNPDPRIPKVFQDLDSHYKNIENLANRTYSQTVSLPRGAAY